MLYLRVLLALCLALCPTISSALYKWVDKNGTTHYSDTPPAELENTIEPFTPAPINRIGSPQPTELFNSDTLSNESRSPKETPRQLKPTSSAYKTHSNIQCFDASPQATGLSNIREPLSDSQQTLVKNLFNDLHGKWAGEAEFIECNGSEGDPDIESSIFSTEMDARVKRGTELRFEFDMRSFELRSSKQETIDFFLNDDFLSYSSSRSDKSITLSLSENAFDIWTAQFSSKGGPREMVRSLHLNNKTLQLNQYLYVNRTLVYMVKWSLKRR